MRLVINYTQKGKLMKDKIYKVFQHEGDVEVFAKGSKEDLEKYLATANVFAENDSMRLHARNLKDGDVIKADKLINLKELNGVPNYN